MSGIMSAFFARYDVTALRAMAQSRNPFASRQAIDLLAEIGGSQIKVFLEGLGKTDAALAAYINKALARAPATEAVSEQDRRLLSEILLEPDESKKRAGVVLADRYRGKPSMDAWLESLTGSPVSDQDAQIYAAVTLVKIHEGNVPDLNLKLLLPSSTIDDGRGGEGSHTDNSIHSRRRDASPPGD